MELKKGYKKTDIGILPEDWEVRKLGEISINISSGKSDTKSQNGNFPIYGSTGIIGYSYQFDYEGTRILVARVGANAGRVNTVLGQYCVSDNTLMIVFKDILDVKFGFYQLIRLNLNSLVFGSGQPLITGTQLKNLQIPLPPLPEQTRIAEVLSDTDSLIRSLEELIEKKKMLKQGAMQTLLQPKEGWEVRKIHEIADVKSGKRLPLGNNLVDNETPYPYIRILDMYEGGVLLDNIKYVPEAVFPAIKNYRIFKDDIYISVAGTLGLIGRIPAILDGANLTENANRLTNISCDVDYLCFVLKSDLIQGKIDSERTLGAQPKLALTRIRNFEIPLPSLEEQTRIATILSDMDAEIAALAGKLQKYRDLKVGLMQELLTGKTRIICL